MSCFILLFHLLFSLAHFSSFSATSGRAGRGRIAVGRDGKGREGHNRWGKEADVGGLRVVGRDECGTSGSAGQEGTSGSEEQDGTQQTKRGWQRGARQNRTGIGQGEGSPGWVKETLFPKIKEVDIVFQVVEELADY